MPDIHNYSKKARQALENIQEENGITKQNKEDAEDFSRWMKTRENMSSPRITRYLISLKQVLKYNDFRLKTADESQIEKIVEQINNSEYYHSDYAQETKREYKKLLRTYYRWENAGELPKKASWITASVSEDQKTRTHPQDLHKPQDIKQIAQNIKGLRDKALLMAHWDLGSRIGETLGLKVKDFYQDNGAWYMRVHGNKNSPDRTCRVDIAFPAVKRWLENGHPSPEDPEAYLFCKVNGDADGSDYASYRVFFNKVKDAVKELGLDCKHGTHIIRKSRVSFLKNQGMPESDVDKRVGHVPGSQVTRDYTRIDDSDANNAYGRMYGNGELEVEKDLVPLRCGECKVVNAGFRDRCYSCNDLLDIEELENKAGKEEEIRELLEEVIREEGLMDKIEEKRSTG